MVPIRPLSGFAAAALCAAALYLAPAPASAAGECDAEVPLPGGHHQAMHRHLLHLLCLAEGVAARDYAGVALLADRKLGLLSNAGKRDGAPDFVEPDQKIWELGWQFRRQASRLAETARISATEPGRADPAALDREFVNLTRACNACHRALVGP